MSLFGPIWQSRNQAKVERFIDRSRDEKKLAMIAAYSQFPELCLKASLRLTQPDQIIFAVSEMCYHGKWEVARKTTESITDGQLLYDLMDAVSRKLNLYCKNHPRTLHSKPDPTEKAFNEFISFLFDRIQDDQILYKIAVKGSHYSFRAVQRIHSEDILLKIGNEIKAGEIGILSVCAERTNDLHILSRYAFSSGHISSEQWKNKFGRLLDADEYREEAQAFLDRILERENRELEAKKAERREKDRIRREADRKKKHEEFLKNPAEELINCTGKRNESSRWKEWYDYQLAKPRPNLLYMISHKLKGLAWYKFFPENALMVIAENSDKHYLEHEDSFSKGKAENDLRYIFQTLYQERPELCERIMALDGHVFYEGRSETVVNFGDHHEDWFVPTESALLPLTLSVSMNKDQSAPQIFLKERAFIPREECLAKGGHTLDKHCRCIRCGTYAHDWEETETRLSITKICRRCGERIAWQTYND